MFSGYDPITNWDSTSGEPSTPNIGTDKWPVTGLSTFLLRLHTPHRDTNPGFTPMDVEYFSWLTEGWAEMLLLPALEGMKEDKSFQHAGKPAQSPAPDHTPASFCVSALSSDGVSYCCEPKEPRPAGCLTLKTSCDAGEMQAPGIKQTVKQKEVDALSLD